MYMFTSDYFACDKDILLYCKMNCHFCMIIFKHIILWFCVCFVFALLLFHKILLNALCYMEVTLQSLACHCLIFVILCYFATFCFKFAVWDMYEIFFVTFKWQILLCPHIKSQRLKGVCRVISRLVYKYFGANYFHILSLIAVELDIHDQHQVCMFID